MGPPRRTFSASSSLDEQPQPPVHAQRVVVRVWPAHRLRARQVADGFGDVNAAPAENEPQALEVGLPRLEDIAGQISGWVWDLRVRMGREVESVGRAHMQVAEDLLLGFAGR